MKNLFLLFILVLSISCAQEKTVLSGETKWQKKMNADFKDASKSPLKDKDRKTFTGLDFFKFDSNFVVKAILKRTPDSEWFNMKTTDDRLSKERIYGVLSFKLKGRKYELNVYQGEELMKTEGFTDYLFLPFLDDTNGTSTYGGGRYIDLRIPNGDVIELDFNKAYNPYCAYDEKYSCPIVPRVNYLDIEVKAGVKAFKK
ncbi:DUF1684 domain-containing protein [Winogradskyella echinorum]|uniref:DUF1684 domain-containing protein n=1 Tax=Winogradskyella echinorum TaxID=538189 RepID=A0ABR6XWL3_9FLAO|nr:DUF1684 domain-containing protein [Winogradskyella echinorum]MBC3844887.1 DUF1684 domain-containing protein [Winogradskyella echinorum]MBC5749235.1 DUF1684 domain-containing protein [Winogradskyella echinorum]